MKTVTTSPLLGGTAFQSQVDAEREGRAEGVHRYRKSRDKKLAKGRAVELKTCRRWLEHWIFPLEAAIRKDAARAEKNEHSEPGFKAYMPVLCSVRPKALAYLTIRAALSECVKNPNGVPFTRVANILGTAATAEAQLRIWRKGGKTKFLAELYRRRLAYKLTPPYVRWFAKLTDPEHIYNLSDMVRIGSFLLWHMIGYSSAGGYGEGEFRLAFHVKMKKRGLRNTRMLFLDKDVLAAIAGDDRVLETLHPVYPPMRVPPFRLSDKERGGYIELKTPLIRRSVKAQREAVAAQAGKMDLFYECLECLGGTAMRVNPEMLSVVKGLYDRGGGVLNIPRRFDYEIPPSPGEGPDLAEWKREAKRIHDANADLSSPRVVFGLVMNMAKKVAHWPELYYPHNCDFRQRCYPIPMYLNHHGDDLPRGLLEFAAGVPCDSEGIRNVAIHAANQWGQGVDKLSFDDRVQWVYDNLDSVVKSAADPLDYSWWMDAKKPLQFLAACMAIRKPERAAHLMWGCDGTFNGMQWYSALSRDEEGARLCNMTDSEVPVVPYRMVAEKVRNALAEIDDPIAARLAAIVDGDFVKPNAMTTTYGVTEYGAKDQIKDKLIAAGFEGMDWHKAAAMATRLTMKAIRQTFPRACALMDYLREVGKTIAEAGHLVDWKTPLGFPVVQPYRHQQSMDIRTCFGRLWIWRDGDAAPLADKQASAMPPHIIHSFDSSHLLMTARACRASGIAFAGVHDGYKTHAQHAATLGDTLRRQFVNMNKGDGPLLACVRYWQAKYPELGIADPPERGTFDVEQVLASRYFFS